MDVNREKELLKRESKRLMVKDYKFSNPGVCRERVDEFIGS
jgi:hypothetical protein